MSLPALVVGTAGHVDHGKTTLVKALTGVDLDRLPEEKERGITIALGFTPLTLPDGRVVGLVDVPGHERLVRTMVAGATGLDAVMLCVSAVEGVMPQTREHLDILGLLGVRRGVLVLTMADQVDDELLELAAEELRAQVAGTLLAAAPIIATSAPTGRGLPELKASLAAITAPARPVEQPFRLPVDRSFARRGFGTVVTGTTWSGRLQDGGEVEILAGTSARRARVRGIQVHGAARAEALPGARTALNLAGVEVETAPRGAWIVAPGQVPSPHVLDVRYHHLPGAPAHEGELHALVLHGTREVEARLVPLDAPGFVPGESCLLQVRAAEPLPSLPQDRFVVRLASPARTIGGGVILDPYSAVSRRSRAVEGLPTLRRLEAGEAEAWLDRAGPTGLPEAELRRRTGQVFGERLGESRFSASVRAALRAELLEAAAEGHRRAPLSPTLNRKSLRAGLLQALGERELLALIDATVAEGALVAETRGVRLPSFQVALSADQERWRAAVLAAAAAGGLEGVADPRKLQEHPDAEALLHLLEERGEVELVGERWYPPATLAGLVAQVRGALAAAGKLDPAAFKELTGQTRRTAIPLLEWLDQNGYTRRSGDERVAGPRLG